MFQPFDMVWTTDLHLGCQLWGKLNPETGLNQMVEKFTDEFYKTCQKVIDLNPKYWLITGDFFHSRNPSNGIREVFTNGISMVLKTGVHIILLPGNHDTPTTLGAKDSLADIRKLQIHGLTIVEESCTILEKSANFICLPWQKNSQQIIEDARKARGLNSGEKEKPVFVLGHFSVEGAVPGSEKDFELMDDFPLPLKEISGVDIAFTFLGHIHKQQMVGPKIMYQGSMDRVSMAERNEPKGSALVHVLSRSNVKIEQLPGTPQKYIQYDIDLKDGSIDQSGISFKDSANAVVKLKITATQDQMKLFNHSFINEELKDSLFVLPIDWNIRRQNEDRRENDVKLEEGKDYLETWLENQIYTPEIKEKVLIAAKKINEARS